MVFQIHRLKFRVGIALIILVLVLVMPVSADLFNGYYKVAPNISQGSTIFIGEEGLDISNALAAANAFGTPTNISTIGWWASPADLYTHTPTISYSLINRSIWFTVNATEFDGYYGEWYLVDASAGNHAKAGTAAVFKVQHPVLQLSIRDPTLNGGADVSGTSIMLGTRLQFQIGTSMYTVLANPSLRSPVYNRTGSGVDSDGFLDIRVRYENGTTFTHLYDDNKQERSLTALNITTQSYTWGMANAGVGPDIDYVWNTYTYPQGTYVVSVQSRLNNMYDNYRSGGAAYTGRTVSETETITLVKVLSEIGVFRPSSGIWYLDVSKSGVVSSVFQFGKSGDIPVTGDWDGNGTSDIGVFRSSTGIWYLDYNKTGVVDKAFQFGKSGDIPVTGDWDGNGNFDTGVFRSSTGIWYLDYNKTGVVDKAFQFGKSGDIPVTGDWDGNGTSDIGVFRPYTGNWYLDYNKSGVVDKTFQFGKSGDIPLVDDWNLNGRSDIGVFRPSAGNWYLDYNKTGVANKAFHFGKEGDTPIAGSTRPSTTPQPTITITFTRNLTIVPYTNVSIPVGSKVIWKNDDPLKPHGIAAVDDPGAEYFGGLTGVQIPYNDSFEVTFNKVGSFNYTTTFQPEISGIVVVT